MQTPCIIYRWTKQNLGQACISFHPNEFPQHSLTIAHIHIVHPYVFNIHVILHCAVVQN